MARVSDKIRFMLFADDTTIYVHRKNIEELIVTQNNELIRWIISNR